MKGGGKMAQNKKNSNENTAAYIARLEEIIQQQSAQLEAQAEQISKLVTEVEKLTQHLLNAQRARFGQSSEKKAYVQSGQNSFFDEVENEQNPKLPEPDLEQLVKEHVRKKKRSRDEMLGDDVESAEIIADLPESSLICGCGCKMVPIGKKFIREELEFIPASVRRIKYYVRTYTCKQCEERENISRIRSGKAPTPLLKHSLASPSTVAHIMTQKYVDGLPLARQEKIWAREGVALSRATMANWVIQCAQKWLKPAYNHMKRKLLESAVIYADETVVQVLKEDGKPASSESRMWVYGSDGRNGQPIRVFEYQPDRSGKHAEKFLKKFSGCLVTDGYAGYNKVEGVTRFGCWAHMRRKWKEAMPKGATMANSKAAVGFNFCTKIFNMEKKFADDSPYFRQTKRQLMAEPLVDEYFLWVKTVNPTPGTKLADAVKYAQNQEQYLRAFLTHGEVEISNNFAENAIRPFAVGRKNWLFCDTTKGAESSAIVYTIVETAKANGQNPFEYLQWLLRSMTYYPQAPSSDSLEGLMPWNLEPDE